MEEFQNRIIVQYWSIIDSSLVFTVTVSAEVIVEEKVISSMSPPRLPVSAVRNAGKSSATGTCEGWDNSIIQLGLYAIHLKTFHGGKNLKIH